MLGAEGERFFQFLAPRVQRLIGTGVDQIERHAVEVRRRQLERGAGLGGIVQSAQHLQIAIIQRLHAQRETVDAGRAIVAKARRVCACGICLERDFDIVGGAPQSCDRVERALNARALHQRRRSTAEEDRFDDGALSPLPASDPLELAHDGIDPAVLVDAASNMRIEVAIGTLCRAERPMDIDAETAHGAKTALPTSFSNARARWLIPCLVAGSISPNVSDMPSATKIES